MSGNRPKCYVGVFSFSNKIAWKCKRVTDGVTYGNGTTDSAMTYTYNLGGTLTSQQYPSGRTVKNVLDTTGNLAMVQSSKNANSGLFTYASAFSYTAAGAVNSMKLGNGKWESTTFNNRLQSTQIALGTVQNGTDKLKLNFDYGSTTNNGNVQTQTITVPGMTYLLVQAYAYDSLNRLTVAAETSNNTPTWKQTFTYDRYGNRRFDEANTTMPSSFANQAVTDPTVSTTNNRLTSAGYSYDNAGNTLTDAGSKTYTYDGENKQVQVNSGSTILGQYYYDGDGKRIKKYVPATGETTIFVYDAAGKEIAEYSTIVEGTSTAKVNYLTNDHLGSPRINTDANGAVIARHDYHPFGEEILTAQRTTALNYAADTIRKQFTTYERDIESSLDFAQARMYGNSLGRFTSPDPYNIIFEKEAGRNRQEKANILIRFISQPQNWNRYVYVVNNPTNLVDPLGLIYLTNGNGTYYYFDNSFYRENKAYIEKKFGKLKILADGTKITLGPNSTGMFAKFGGQTVVLGTGGLIIPTSYADSVGSPSSSESAEHGSNQSDSVSARPSAILRTPDFFQAEGDIPLIGLGGLAIQATLERNGQSYFGIGGYLGFPGLNASGGYLPQRYRAYQHENNSFLTGASIGGFTPAGLGGTYSNNGQFAPQIGTPTKFSVNATYGLKLVRFDCGYCNY